MASKNFGYQGFVPYAFRPAEATKPGEQKKQRDNKFRKAGGDVVAYDAGRFSSTAMRQSRNCRKGHYAAKREMGTLQIKDRQPMPQRKFVATSLYSSTFPNYKEELLSIEKPTEAQYRDAFDSLDKDKSGALSKNEIKALLESVVGGNQRQLRPNTVALFMTFFDKNKDNKVDFNEFCSGLVGLRKLMKQQLDTRALRHAGPAWLQDSEVRVCQGYVPNSSTRIDLGAEGDNPLQRQAMTGIGMKGTTEDLFSGTSKVTHHIPGYRGYISKVSPIKAERTRDSRNGMFVVDTYKFNAAGYTGNPRAKWDKGMGGMQTSKSSTDKLIDEMWQSRRAGKGGAIN